VPFRVAVDQEISAQGIAITRIDRSADAGGLFDSDVAAAARASVYGDLVHDYTRANSVPQLFRDLAFTH
jgi:hypothetical protein